MGGGAREIEETTDFPFPSVIGSLHILSALGQGTYGKVHAAVDANSQERFAIKRIRKETPESNENLHHQQQKEIMIHKSLRHPNIIRLHAVEETVEYYYLVLEIAAGGELFDRIEPDFGLPAPLVHFYFAQLMQAVQYCHGQGVAHRDIKPENILLDQDGNLKLTDFGLGTVFTFRGKRRTLTTLCGTAVYLAPEVINLCYEGDACDLWSCGVVLYVLLVGNTPWEEPSLNSPEFSKYVKNYPNGLDFAPWNQLDSSLKELLLGLLCPDPAERWTMERIQENAWIKIANPFMDQNGQCSDPDSLAYTMAEYRNGSSQQYKQQQSQEQQQNNDEPFPSLSQPEIMHRNQNTNNSQMMVISTQDYGRHSDISFSQPMQDRESSSSSSYPTNNGGSGKFVVMNQLLTRFYCAAGVNQIMEQLMTCLESFLVPYKRVQSNKLTFSTVDKRKCPLSGEIKIHPIPDKNQSIVVFQRSKGDPIEFKRFYRIILKENQELIIEA